MTARQNIYMNGSIMGMTRHEIDRKLDEIVDFAGIARYLDTPVKRFSSGMTVRLGFAVAAFLEPEILVVDEVLAVGDAEFQKKAIGKMQDVSQSGGRTVLFVSHNMAAVKKLCKHGILLEKGMVKYSGNIKDVVDNYIAGSGKPSQNVYFDDLTKAPGNETIRIRSFEVTPCSGKVVNVESGIHFKLVFQNYKPNIILDATMELRTVDDIVVFHTGKVVSPEKDAKVGEYTVEFSLPPFYINTGKYRARIWFGEAQRYVLWGTFEHIFEIENTLTGQGYNMATLPGILKPHFDFNVSYNG